MNTVLVTGGAGFIGTHLVRALRGRVQRIIVVDSLLPQVHRTPRFSAELTSAATCIHGDIREQRVWEELSRLHPEIDVVVHLAALTGTGQSMHELRDYDAVNAGGTAALLQALLERRAGQPQLSRVKRVVLASSRAIYGEGAYRNPNDPSGTLLYPALRTSEAMARGSWGLYDEDGVELVPVPTPETAPASPTSFYGATKLVQEHYAHTMLAAAGIPLTALRFQNVFGPGQSLKNPYTGVIGVFYSNIMGGRPIDIYEDGEISRDFVYVSDAVQAIAAAVESDRPGTYNIGSGQFTKMTTLARTLCTALGRQVEVACGGNYRVGDIRHNAADLTRAERALGYRPRVSVEQGLHNYVEWARSEEPMDAATVAAAATSLGGAGRKAG